MTERQQEEVINDIFETIAYAAPHIRNGMLQRRNPTGTKNSTGDKQIEADLWTHKLLTELISNIEGVGEIASEESEKIIHCGNGLSVSIDPLDGSSNIPTNNLVGVIVGVYDEPLPSSGQSTVAGMTMVFGPLTTIVKSHLRQVDEYVVEEKQGNQVEIHKVNSDLELKEPKIYGFGGREPNWTKKFKKFAEEIKKDYKLRYGGAMVGDINQVIHHGGIFAYPELKDRTEGKLRLQFEGFPMAYIIESMNGKSSNGEKSLLKLDCQELHQRTPVYLGNKELVEEAEQKDEIADKKLQNYS